MFDTAIQLLLTDDDLVFKNFRSTIDKVLAGEITSQSRKEYALVKLLHRKTIEEFCLQSRVDIEEQLLYDILEMCLFFENDFEYSNAHELANLLKIDPDIKTYIEHHVLNDGIWARLKYKIPITNRLDVMTQALSHCESA